MITRRHVRGAAASTAVALMLGLGGCSSGSGSATSPAPASTTPAPTQTPTSGPGASSLPARWWSWVESAPAGHNPVEDTTGADCAQGQPDDVWFLAGTYGGAAERSCTVPLGREVYAPVINTICAADGSSDDDAIDSCRGAVDSASASLDGRALVPTEGTSETAFAFTAKPGSSTPFDPGTHDAVAWGLWIGPLPLTAGQHTLEFTGTSGAFTTKVTYRLTVASP